MSPYTSIKVGLCVALALVVSFASMAAAHRRPDRPPGDLGREWPGWPSLDGSGNNVDDADRGRAGTAYPRLAPARYADGIGQPAPYPASPRYISNRIFNDTNQNVFSARGVTHWGVAWGQFVDHSIGLRLESAEATPLPFDAGDPLESFRNPTGSMPFTRSAAVEGTGVDTPREQLNTVSSYLDAWAVYGGTAARLDWLRAGPSDGDPTNNDARLLLPGGFLPTAAARPEVEAPTMERFGVQHIDPGTVVIAGDVRANENLALTTVQTLFAREHNRIVERLPDSLPDELRFQIARRVVMAEQQWITYNEFLPAMGVELEPYRGYDPDVDASLSNEFATIAYRAHSQIHGEFEAAAEADEYSDAALAAIAETGAEVAVDGDEVEFVIPLNVAFGRPELLPAIGLGRLAAGLASEADYANDEMIDNQLRSVLFQTPEADPDDCLDGPDLPQCFTAVMDLGALDLARGYDHGLPGYNELRQAVGLAPRSSFTEVTGEATGELPAGTTIDDPAILEFLELRNRDGELLEPDSPEAEADTVSVVRGSTVAARLGAIYGTVDELDAFTGMLAEPRLAGSELGELQRTMWTLQFGHLRDGDRFFYANDPALDAIEERFGVSFRVTLGEVILANTDLDELPNDDVFRLDLDTVDEGDGAGDQPPPRFGPNPFRTRRIAVDRVCPDRVRFCQRPWSTAFVAPFRSRRTLVVRPPNRRPLVVRVPTRGGG